jgi:Ca2+-binding RTX toxin-like protein
MSGGQDNDTYYVDNAGDVVNETAGQGTDTVYASVNWTLTAGSEVEALRANSGGAGRTLTGNELVNHIFGGIGADVLDGAGGNDALTGGAGADTFAFGAAGGDDAVTDFNWDAGDRVRLDDGIKLESADAKDVDGNSVDDTILQFSDGSATLLNTGNISAHYNDLFIV